MFPGAKADWTATAKTIAAMLGRHVISLAQAQRMLQDATRKMLAQAYTDDGADSYPIACNGCGKVVVVASDVVRYKCHCSPQIERYTFQSRDLNLPIGVSAVEDVMSASTGRETLTFP